MKKTTSDFVLLGAGLTLSLIVVLGLPNLYFHKDLEAFWNWSQIWKLNWLSIYSSCPTCNYPILGMFSSAGFLNLFSGLGYDRSVFIFRLFLSIVDGANVLLIFWILKSLKVAKPAYTAGIIGISISSWAGGAIWGQIDGISQFFILISLAWIVKNNINAQAMPKYYWSYLVVSAVLLACILLTKQLTILSVFSIGLLLATDILFHSPKWKERLLNAALTMGVFLAAISAWDLFLKLKPPYFSHLVYIWQEGVFQAGIISGNGFNIWMLLGRDMFSSAHMPMFAGIPGSNPYQLGLFLFVLLTGMVTVSLGLWLRQKYQRGEAIIDRETLLNFILHLALVNLCCAVFLTGTRERYLFHFYPYIILAWTGLSSYSRLFSEKILSSLVLAATLYGLFVLQILSTLDFRLGTSTHMIMAVLHLGLFTCLLIVTLQYQNFSRNLGQIFSKTRSNLPTER